MSAKPPRRRCLAVFTSGFNELRLSTVQFFSAKLLNKSYICGLFIAAKMDGLRQQCSLIFILDLAPVLVLIWVRNVNRQ